MKTRYLCLGIVLLAGCGKDADLQSKASVTYPALHESPPPPPPPLSQPASTPEPSSAQPAGPPAELLGDSWFQREAERINVVERLREYSAKAAPGDPFALTEKELDAFSILEDPALF